MEIVKLNSNREGWERLISALRVSGVVAVDIETAGEPGKGQDGALEPHRGRIRLVQFATDARTAYILDMFQALGHDIMNVADIVIDPSVVKISHNAKFEIAWFIKHVLKIYHNRVRPKMWFCTQLAAQVLRAGDVRINTGLKDAVDKYLAVKLDKTEQSSDWSAPELSDEQIIYAANDVLVLPELRRKLVEALVAADLARVAGIEMDALIPLAEMEVHGFHLDIEAWRVRLERLTKERNFYESEVKMMLAGYADFDIKVKREGRKPLKPEFAGWTDMGLAMNQIKGKPDLQELRKQEENRQSALLAEWYKACEAWQSTDMVRAGEKINLNSPSQVKQALVKLTGDESITSTSEKFLADKIAAYEETMTNERLPEAERKKAEERFNVLKMLIDFRGFDKAVSSYGENYIRACDANGRIHANFKQIEAETGRMASGASKKGEPKINLQNVPRDAETRGCFTAPLRRKLLIADFSTIELRILAEMSKDPKFIRAFSKDLHKYSASVFFKVPYEAVDKDLRQKGKNCGFAMVYGAGPFRISQITGGSKEDAAESLSNYRAEFKGNARWLDAAQKQARFQGYSRTLAGRLAKFNSGYIWNEQKKAEARGDNETAKKLKGQLAAIARNGSNSPIQGSSADLTKRAMYLAAERFEGHDVFLVNVVHDEIVCECDERIAEWAAEQLKQAMEQAGREFLTVVDCPVDVHIGDSWAEKG